MRAQWIREWLEVRQIRIYLAAVIVAAGIAWLVPATVRLEPAIEPLLAFMLFVTFLQVPLGELRRSITNVRFLAAVLAANFVAVPLLVAGLLPLLPGDPMVRIAVLLVLLTPCIDYVVTFAHLGKSDAKALLASTPLLLAVQMALLPFYLRAFLDASASDLVAWGPFLNAFLYLIAGPLILAGACQAWAAVSSRGERLSTTLGMLPVPATAAVLFVVVAAVAPQVGQASASALAAAPAYVVFAVVAPLLGWVLGRGAGLPASQARAVAFSSATRNSLVVLPLGLAIPGAIPVIPAVIVTQTIIELVSELAYVKLLARLR